MKNTCKEINKQFTNIFVYLQDDIAQSLGTPAYPWRVKVSLFQNGHNISHYLGGTTEISFTRGWANFTNLYVRTNGSDFNFEFIIVYPADGVFVHNTSSATFDMEPRKIGLQITNITNEVVEQENISMIVSLVDTDSMQVIDNLDWKVRTYMAICH